MPLRDHFRSPLADRRSWDGLHGGWPMMIVAGLEGNLPERYVAEPQIHLGSSFQIDVATYDQDQTHSTPAVETNGGAGIATAIWAPPQPTLAVATDLPDLDEYEVRVYDTKAGGRRNRQPGQQGPARAPPRLRRQVRRAAPGQRLRRDRRPRHDTYSQPL